VILVDTDVLIANLRGIDAARDWLRDVTRLLSSLRSLPVTDMIASRAGELRRRYRRSHAAIGLVDYLIAATAQVHGLELVTLNTKHFPMFADLKPPFQR